MDRVITKFNAWERYQGIPALKLTVKIEKKGRFETNWSSIKVICNLAV